jgi:hypothetical protein
VVPARAYTILNQKFHTFTVGEIKAFIYGGHVLIS